VKVLHSRARTGLRRLSIIGLAAIALLAACSGVSTTPSATPSTAAATAAPAAPMVVGILAPFTGPDAALGPAYFAACLPAVREINAAGGVMGHQLSCKQFDTRGDPADAVPAARQMVASTPNLMMVIGCTSDEASSVAPVLEQNHIPAFCQTGQSEFNKSSFQYFHRLVPPDEYDAYAMVGSALDFNHYQKVALVFGNDIGSQAFVAPATRALTKLGATVVIDQAIALGQPSYRTEVTKMLAAKPDVIFTEALGSTDATYMAEVKQLNGSMIPVIGTSATIDPVWFKAVSAAIGIPDLLKYFQAVDVNTTFSGTGYDTFKAALLASAADFADAPKYAQRGATLHLYDGVVMTALAMDTAKSTDPTVYNPVVTKIGNGVTGAVVVNTYKQGVDALKAGSAVRFSGAGGPTLFNEWNNSQGGYILVKYDDTGGEVTIGQLTQDQTDLIIKAGGS
jgi:ABC-type branched-subunit amino acid transport system substrate-binding protein